MFKDRNVALAVRECALQASMLLTDSLNCSKHLGLASDIENADYFQAVSSLNEQIQTLILDEVANLHPDLSSRISASGGDEENVQK